MLTQIFIVLCIILVSCIEFSVSVPVVIDSDGGPDDAMGVLLLLWQGKHPRSQEYSRGNGGRNKTLDLVAITSVAGNTDVQNATRNLKATLEVGERKDIPVYMGANTGLTGKRDEDDFFGQDGFGDFLPPLRRDPSASNIAVTKLVELSKQYSGVLILICIGPLTNIALAQRQDPNFLRRLGELHIMGGSVKNLGTMQYGMEFNIVQDPEAADVVFSEYQKTVFVFPFDPLVINPIAMTWRLHVLGQLHSKSINFLNQAERKDLNSSFPTWNSADPQAVAAALWPQLVTKSRRSRVVVETSGVYSRGAFLVDKTATSKNENAQLIEEINRNFYQQLLIVVFST